MDLLIVVGLSLLMVPLVILTGGALRMALGLVFVLFSPGYVVVAAFFPGKEGLDGVQRLALSLGLSVAVVPLIGLVLNYTLGVRLYPILVSLLVFISIMAAIAWHRRRRIAPGQRFDPPVGDSLRRLPQAWLNERRSEKGLTVGLLLAVVGALTMAGYAVANPGTGEVFTEFYVLGPGGEADNYPEWLVPGQGADLVLGIVNREGRTATYNIAVSTNGEVVQALGPITLAEGEKREEGVSVRTYTVGDSQKIEFALYEDNSGDPKETLCLWIDVQAVA